MYKATLTKNFLLNNKELTIDSMTLPISYSQSVAYSIRNYHKMEVLIKYKIDARSKESWHITPLVELKDLGVLA